MHNLAPEELINEIWKPIPDYEELYEVSNLGRVRGLRSGSRGERCIVRPFTRILRGYKNGNRRGIVLCKDGIHKHKFVHRLVAAAFIGVCPPNYVVNHKDADPSNNRLPNLEYLTIGENNRYTHSLGRGMRGETHYNAKIDEATAREIKQLRNIISQGELSKRFGISRGAISAIHRGENWKHI